jgi:ABC-2 type transport system permease protein
MVRKYAAMLRACWSISLEYRAEGFVWMMTNLLSIIMMLVWLSISSAGPVNGFTSGDFVAYYMVGLIVRHMTGAWTSYELDAAIREGTLSPQMLRPIHPVHWHVAANWSEKVLRLGILLPLVVLMFILTPAAHLYLTPLNIGAFLLSLVGAWLISFLSDYTIGILSFWTSQVSAFNQVMWGLRLVLSGILAPIQMFPQLVQNALDWLPFRYMLAFSNEIALGQTQGERLLFGFAAQWAWVAFFFLLSRVLWKLGTRNYSAVGA